MKYDEFKNMFMTVLNSHAPTKQRTLRGNNQPFMNKTVSQAFMHRSKLKSISNKNPTQANKNGYKRQRNFCVNLLAREKERFYNNLDLRILNDNKTFWQNIKPLFSNKQNILQKNITLIEKDEIISKDNEVAEKLNTFFIEAVKNLEIEPFNDYSQDTEIIISKYKTHPSILEIKEEVKVESKFKFADSTPYSIQNDIQNLDPRKASTEKDLPAKILIGSSDIVGNHLSSIYNNAKNESTLMGLHFADFADLGQIRENPRNFIPRNICFAVIREIKSPRNIWKKGLIREICHFFQKTRCPQKHWIIRHDYYILLFYHILSYKNQH